MRVAAPASITSGTFTRFLVSGFRMETEFSSIVPVL
jgi:hypothetical protein